MGLVCSVATIGCGTSTPEEHQRLVAAGQLLTADGATPLAGMAVDRYQVTFVVAGENGDAEINRLFSEDESGAGIVTDADGWFRVASPDLALAYDWQRDELVCGEVCVAWDTVCDQVTEEICLDTCTEEQCWDECWDDCAVECWDEEVCDGDGNCWVETVCEEYCTEVCETVCDTVSYGCNCYLDTYEVCDDQCVESAEECEWVTRTYTSAASLGDVIGTRTTVWVHDETLAEHLIDGDLIEAQQHEGCNAAGECGPVDLWVQKDRFVVPFRD